MDNQMPVSDQQHDSSHVMPTPVMQTPITPLVVEEKPKINFVPIVIAILISGIVFGVGGFLVGQQSGKTSAVTPVESPLPSAVVEASPLPSSNPVLPIDKEKAVLASMEGWKIENIDGLSFKLPATSVFTKVECSNSFESCYTITKHDLNHLSPPVSVAVKEYKGGVLKEEAEVDPSTLENYSFTERLYGSVEATDALFSCKIKECVAYRSIIFVVGDKLVKVVDGVYKTDNNSTTLESSVINAAVSSFVAETK